MPFPLVADTSFQSTLERQSRAYKHYLLQCSLGQIGNPGLLRCLTLLPAVLRGTKSGPEICLVQPCPSPVTSMPIRKNIAVAFSQYPCEACIRDPRRRSLVRHKSIYVVLFAWDHSLWQMLHIRADLSCPLISAVLNEVAKGVKNG